VAEHRLSFSINGRKNQPHTLRVSFETLGLAIRAGSAGTGSVGIAGSGYGLPALVELPVVAA
jgi:hypothetical protein